MKAQGRKASFTVAAAAAFAVAGWAGAAAAVDLVIIHSDVLGLEPGDTIDGSTDISLPEGKKLVVVLPDGESLTIKGPFKGKAPVKDGSQAADGSFLGAFAKRVAEDKSYTKDLGAVRDLADEVKDPKLVVVNMSGHQCLFEPEETSLWQTTKKGGTDFTVKGPGLDDVKLGWSPTAPVFQLPPGMTFQDGGSYSFAPASGGAASTITFHLVPSHLKTDAHRYLWMMNQQCIRQAALLMVKIVNK